MSGLGTAELIFLLLLLFVVVFGVVARKLKTAYPIVMVIGGLVLSLIPGIPQFTLEPDLIFLIILPPLLYSAAWTTSWRDFRYNLPSILLLAFVMVGVTVLGVALAAPHVFAGFDWRLGLALGAVVAPTDAIAATSIASRIGLPAQIVDILEGESLINDATGLLALEFATAIVVENHIPTAWEGVSTFTWLILGGVGLGLLVGWIALRIEHFINDGPIEFILSILIPYAVYFAAESVHASGVLGVVVCGLFLSRQSVHFFSPAVRIQIWSVWQSLTFTLNGLVFVLIGLQLPTIRASIHDYSRLTLLTYGIVFSALLIVLRLMWVFPGAQLAYFYRHKVLHQKVHRPSAREMFIVGWTGMRGVVSLAAALALPVTLANGAPFPQRNIIVYLAFCVIVVTLVLQGITLPSLIHALGLAGAPGPNCEEQEARRIVTEAALSYLEDEKGKDDEEAIPSYDDLTRHYRQRLAGLMGDEENPDVKADHDRFVQLSLEALRVERETAIRLRNQNRINDQVLRRIERELDLTESRLAGDAG
ncbi:MAG TPA: Na+/H+ antiporter [Bryobacteraceae bacterium]|jgi:CPA1 family monovalent cation:H+ antiporter|nr:Na+/H+ antiporter [Bryobacteraceae bacterium]